MGHWGCTGSVVWEFSGNVGDVGTGSSDDVGCFGDVGCSGDVGVQW